jgi:hypothetical protein
MTWNVTAETVRCKGRLAVGHRAGKPVTFRCETVLFVGSWFWLDTTPRKPRPLCPFCASDPGQHEGASQSELNDRLKLLEHRHRGGPARTIELLRLSEPYT